VNPLERLRDDVGRRFPGLTLEIDAPADAEGPWFLDIQGGAAGPLVVEWRPGLGFGVSPPGADEYGSGPAEVHTDAGAVLDRLAELLRPDDSP
jgi:hypothetical protein